MHGSLARSLEQAGRFMLADSAYTEYPWLIKRREGGAPQTKGHAGCALAPAKREDVLFDNFISAFRVRVEHAFGILKKMWALARIPSHVPYDLLPAMLYVICCLHNLTRRIDATNEQYVGAILENEEYERCVRFLILHEVNNQGI